MKTAELLKNVEYKEESPVIRVVLETTFTKEIRIVMKKGQIMKEHQTPFSIVVEIVDGKIDFGVQDKILHLKRGALIALEGGVPHNLKAITNSIVRLTLTKADKSERVKNVING